MAVAPLRGGTDDAARAALGALLQHHLSAAAQTRAVPVQAAGDEACDTALCLTQVAQQACARYAVAVDWTGFGRAAVLTAHGWDARAAAVVVEVAARADTPEQLPAAVEALATALEAKLGLGTPAALAEAGAADAPLFDLAVKFGTGSLSLSSLKDLTFKFDFEADYNATDNLLVFADASLILGNKDGSGSVSLVPVLLGAKYLFRPAKLLRPYVGMGLGLGFLSSSADSGDQVGTQFSIFGVGGVQVVPWKHFGFVAEGSLNLSGVEVSTNSGLLFAFSFNAGVVVPF